MIKSPQAVDAVLRGAIYEVSDAIVSMLPCLLEAQGEDVGARWGLQNRLVFLVENLINLNAKLVPKSKQPIDSNCVSDYSSSVLLEVSTQLEVKLQSRYAHAQLKRLDDYSKANFLKLDSIMDWFCLRAELLYFMDACLLNDRVNQSVSSVSNSAAFKYLQGHRHLMDLEYLRENLSIQRLSSGVYPFDLAAVLEACAVRCKGQGPQSWILCEAINPNYPVGAHIGLEDLKNIAALGHRALQLQVAQFGFNLSEFIHGLEADEALNQNWVLATGVNADYLAGKILDFDDLKELQGLGVCHINLMLDTAGHLDQIECEDYNEIKHWIDQVEQMWRHESKDTCQDFQERPLSSIISEYYQQWDHPETRDRQLCAKSERWALYLRILNTYPEIFGTSLRRNGRLLHSSTVQHLGFWALTHARVCVDRSLLLSQATRCHQHANAYKVLRLAIASASGCELGVPVRIYTDDACFLVDWGVGVHRESRSILSFATKLVHQPLPMPAWEESALQGGRNFVKVLADSDIRQAIMKRREGRLLPHGASQACLDLSVLPVDARLMILSYLLPYRYSQQGVLAFYRGVMNADHMHHYLPLLSDARVQAAAPDKAGKISAHLDKAQRLGWVSCHWVKRSGTLSNMIRAFTPQDWFWGTMEAQAARIGHDANAVTHDVDSTLELSGDDVLYDPSSHVQDRGVASVSNKTESASLKFHGLLSVSIGLGVSILSYVLAQGFSISVVPTVLVQIFPWLLNPVAQSLAGGLLFSCCLVPVSLLIYLGFRRFVYSNHAESLMPVGGVLKTEGLEQILQHSSRNPFPKFYYSLKMLWSFKVPQSFWLEAEDDILDGIIVALSGVILAFLSNDLLFFSLCFLLPGCLYSAYNIFRMYQRALPEFKTLYIHAQEKDRAQMGNMSQDALKHTHDAVVRAYSQVKDHAYVPCTAKALGLKNIPVRVPQMFLPDVAEADAKGMVLIDDSSVSTTQASEAVVLSA